MKTKVQSKRGNFMEKRYSSYAQHIRALLREDEALQEEIILDEGEEDYWIHYKNLRK